MENPWLSSKFARPKLLQILALLLQIKFHSWKCVLNWVLKRTFLTRCPGIGHQNNFPTRRFTGAPLRFSLILPDQGFFKVWALLLRSKFHSCKCIWDWVLRRNFQHNMSCYWLPEQVSGLTFLRAPVQFPLIWYFWILGIDGKPLTFMKMSLTKTPPRSGPCSFGASSIPANVYGIDFWKELSNTTRTSIGHQSNFLPWPFTRAPYHFPFIWYFITQVLIENPWLSSKFAVQGFSKV